MKNHGWRALDAAYRAGLKNAEPDKETEDKALPELSEGQTLPSLVQPLRRARPPAQALHRGYLAFCDGDCREGRYAGGRRAQGLGTRPPLPDSGKAGVHRLSGTEKEQENRAAPAVP